MEWKSFLIYSFFGTVATYLFGGWNLLLEVLLFFVVLDIVTGFLQAFINKTIRSRVMWEGLARKTLIFVVVAVANKLDLILGNGFPMLKTAVLYLYISMEGMSILENLGKAGLTIPDFIKDRLQVMKENGQGDSKGQLPEQVKNSD